MFRLASMFRLLLVLPALVLGQTYSRNGYSIALTGSSGKFQFSVDARANSHLSAQQDRLTENQADGTQAQFVNSWAAQSFTWGQTGCYTSKNADLIVCDRLAAVSVKPGNGKSVEYYGEAALTNNSFYSACTCPSTAINAGPATKDGLVFRQPFSNYDAATNGFCFTCATQACVVLTASGGAQLAAAGACGAGNLTVSVQAYDGAVSTDYNNDAVLCPVPKVCVNTSLSPPIMAAQSGGTCANSSYAAVSVDRNSVALATQTLYTADSCLLTPVHSLKFTMEVNNWPWDDAANNHLRWGVELKSNAGANVTSSSNSTVKYDNGLELLSAETYTKCTNCTCQEFKAGNACQCTTGQVTSALDTSGNKRSITYTFVGSAGAKGVCYDPTFAEQASTTSAGVSLRATSTSLLGAMLLVVMLALW